MWLVLIRCLSMQVKSGKMIADQNHIKIKITDKSLGLVELSISERKNGKLLIASIEGIDKNDVIDKVKKEIEKVIKKW